MKFAEIAHNKEVQKVLRLVVDEEKVPHAILLHEEAGSGAFAIAMAFLQYLFCSNRIDGDSCGVCPSCNKISKLIHSDIHFVFPLNAGTRISGKIDELRSSQFMEYFRPLALSNPYFTEEELYDAIGIGDKSGVISTGAARDILQKLSFTSLEGGYNVVLVFLPEKLNIQAGNKLLKIIEEPPTKTLFLLISHQPDKVLSTIISRCQRFRIIPQKTSNKQLYFDEYAALFAELMEALISKRLSLALDMGEKLSNIESKEKQKAFCKFAVDSLRRIFLLQQKLDSIWDLEEKYLAQYKLWSSSVKGTFPRLAVESFNQASFYLARNVNKKLVFTELVMKLATAV